MKHSYGQFCTLARALDVIGERWTFLIVRDLLCGPKRFKDLQISLDGMGSNLLSERLKSLERSGIIAKAEKRTPAITKIYQLTEKGYELEPIIVSIASWGLKYIKKPRGSDHWLPHWNPIAFKARFLRDKAKDVHDVYALEVDGYTHHLAVHDGDLMVHEGVHLNPSFSLKASSKEFCALAEETLNFEYAIKSKAISFEGNLDALSRFSRIFGLNQEA
jgi:DNA-binding HxlR family transcriptional regulator